MKTLKILLVIAFVIFSGFARDSQTDEKPTLKLMKGCMCMSEANVPRMLIQNTPVIDVDGKTLVPPLTMVGEAWLTGHATHMGNFIGGQSSMTGVTAHLDMNALTKGKIVLVADYYGRITGANGDYFDFETSIEIDATDESHRIITGTYTLTGGSGKFENASGGGVLNGVIPCWYVEGTLEYTR